MIDATHDAKRRSWVESANGHPDFPIQNLPFGVYSKQGEKPRGGVAIGDAILDLKIASEAGLFSGEAKRAAETAGGPRLNGLFALGAGPRAALRARLSDLLDADGSERREIEGMKPLLLTRAADCTMHLPARIGGYTDFFAGIHHATNAGQLLRPENPLLPNYKHIPVAYHGRASSIRASGTPVRRPYGQRKPQAATEPDFGPCRYLDYELEIGVWIGPGNDLGKAIPIGAARQHVAGFCLLNDWSARDIQAWEYQPLGPFLAKNFASTVSSWVVTPEALAPFRTAQPARPDGDPRPLDYLMDGDDQAAGAFGIDIEASILTETMRTNGAEPHRLAASNAQHLYWTVAQMVAHHTCGGCNLEPGDLIGTGTISAPDGVGSMLELTRGGREPVTLPSGETRRFLDDGDEVIFRAYARRDGFAQIGFGECRGRVVGAA
ncbi:MAG TPA: fumarylacetoacetase [Xanthobacteraceae bacterium]|nr:fumarylacetoacetase [Xanthobacteraceae bacterium]